MVLTVKLAPAVAERLTAEAARRGVPPADYAGRLIESSLESAGASAETAESNEQRAQAILAWAASHDPTRPAPPAETYSRDNIYG